MNVYEKLQHVQSGLKAPKNQYNKFGNYFYRNCEDIQEAAKPLLQEVKAALVVGDEQGRRPTRAQRAAQRHPGSRKRRSRQGKRREHAHHSLNRTKGWIK